MVSNVALGEAWICEIQNIKVSKWVIEILGHMARLFIFTNTISFNMNPF
jgi:hypothetical protein